MANPVDLKSAYQPTDFVKQIYDIQNNRLLTWRQRYPKNEYPYKVALNSLYQLLTCELMWSTLINSFTGKRLFDEFSEAYSFIQNKSGQIATTNVHKILESKYQSLQRISILDMNFFRSLVSDAQNGNNEKVQEVERAYIWYTGAVELIYGWTALGLTGKDIQIAITDMCGILIGGNYTNMDTAITNFGMIIETCNEPLDNLW